MNRKGFTLIELITVVIIIAILVALALPQYTRLIERGQGSAAKAALDGMRKGEGMYFALWSTYASNITALTAEVPEIGRLNSSQDWQYAIQIGDDTVFTATARRSRGRYAGDIVSLDNEGVLGGGHPSVDNNW